MGWGIVKESTVAMKLITLPLAFVGFVIGLVIKSSLTLHFVLAPLSVIVSSILVVKPSGSLTHAVNFVSLIPASNFEMLNNVLRLPFNRLSIRNVCCLGKIDPFHLLAFFLLTESWRMRFHHLVVDGLRWPDIVINIGRRKTVLIGATFFLVQT